MTDLNEISLGCLHVEVFSKHCRPGSKPRAGRAQRAVACCLHFKGRFAFPGKRAGQLLPPSSGGPSVICSVVICTPEPSAAVPCGGVPGRSIQLRWQRLCRRAGAEGSRGGGEGCRLGLLAWVLARDGCSWHAAVLQPGCRGLQKVFVWVLGVGRRRAGLPN